MGLQIGAADGFERRYSAAFDRLAAAHGLQLKYEQDRAAIDRGLHLTIPAPQGETVTDTRIWFQLKGKRQSALPREQFEAAAEISLTVEIEHLRQWYRSPEPVYLVLYIEAVDGFLAVDVKTLVDRRWGDRILHPAFKSGQQTITLHIPKESIVDAAFWQGLRRHQAMRIDGPTYRGNPLAHRRDPRGDTLCPVEPGLFQEVIQAVLAAHGYQVRDVLDPAPLFPHSAVAGDQVMLTCGLMYEPYEWIPRLTAELIPDENGYRADGQIQRVQGPCAVLIHAAVGSRPNIQALQRLRVDLAAQGIRDLLVFINAYLMDWPGSPQYCGTAEYLQGVGCLPQHLEDISRLVLLTNVVYLQFRDRLTWWSDYSQEKIEAGEWRVLTPEQYFQIPREQAQTRAQGDAERSDRASAEPANRTSSGSG